MEKIEIETDFAAFVPIRVELVSEDFKGTLRNVEIYFSLSQCMTLVYEGKPREKQISGKRSTSSLIFLDKNSNFIAKHMRHKFLHARDFWKKMPNAKSCHDTMSDKFHEKLCRSVANCRIQMRSLYFQRLRIMEAPTMPR